jgi:hypothetical protein
MSKFDTLMEKVFGSLNEDNTGLPPTSSNILPDNTTYDYTVSVVKELIRNGLLDPVNIREFIVGDDVNKGFYFIWDFKDISYVVRVLPSDVSQFQVTITNLKDKTDVRRVDLHEEDAVSEVVDYLNQKRQEREDNENKPTQVSNEPSALPGGIAPAGETGTPQPNALQSGTPAVDSYLQGLK